MLYKIPYHEISDYKYDVSIAKIFSKISDIKYNILQKNTFVIIAFDKDVKFISPLFFILLFDLHYEYEFTLVIDIDDMEKTSQQYIHRLMTQYSDLEYFKIYSRWINKEKYDFIKNSTDIEKQLEIQVKQDDKLIHLITSVNHKKSLISDEKYEYSMLPILKLRNFNLKKELDTFVHEKALSPYKQRRIFYNQLSLEQAKKNIEQYRENLQNKINELLMALGLSERGLSSSFRDIFFELIDNIRKHTPNQFNAHISFRKDKISDQYELIVSDNSSIGFLNTYKETLEKEIQKLVGAGVKKELLKNYEEVVNDIESKEYKKVLEGLFKFSNNPDGKLHVHQIPRLAMHFGLPVLVKLLEKLSKKSADKKPRLKLYIHNDNHFFEITYSYENTKGDIDIQIDSDSSHTKEGTYIIVTFPADVKISNEEKKNSLGKINLQNSDYKTFLKYQDHIKKDINKFIFCLDKQVINFEKLSNDRTGKCIVVKYTKQDNITFSDFIRAIYLYAYKYELEDIVIVNTPLYEDKTLNSSENIEHIKLLSNIIYYDGNTQYEKSLNILFYSDRYPEAILIGGKNKDEFIQLNKSLPKWNKPMVRVNDTAKNIMINSNLFVNIDNKDYLIPFEIFHIWDEDRRNDSDSFSSDDELLILQDMLEVYLNKVAKRDGVHIDTKNGYHIDRFMEFKKVFEDSRWVKRLAFRLAIHFTDIKRTKYYLIGMDKYTNMLISLCYTFLDLKDFKQFKYKLFSIYNEEDYKEIDKKINDIQESNQNDNYKIYLVSSVNRRGKKVEKLIEKYESININAIAVIHLNITDSRLSKYIKSIINIENKEKIEEITSDKYCSACETNRQIPLLELSEKDPFFIKDTFFEFKLKKQIKSYGDKNQINIKWFDSLYFGHIEREDNHFLYYIDTIKFFNQNRGEIENFLGDYVKKEKDNKKENIVIFTSSHDTNNNFVALVNQKVFDNEAIVLNFDKRRGEANFHDLEYYKDFDWKNTTIFFVDDSIASTQTIKYFYQLLSSISDDSRIKFDGMVIMIDRISSYDEIILQSYVKGIENFFAFSTFNVKPIKTDVERCFLCEREEEYNNLAKQTALDLTTFQIARRANKLQKIQYRKVKTINRALIDRFKTYLKAMATNYIYQNYAHEQYSQFWNFDRLIEYFTEKIYNNLKVEDIFKKYDQELLKNIIKFQSEISLIKALSFPKLSYHYNIRKWAIKVILSKLNEEVEKVYSENFKLVYLFEGGIEDNKSDAFLKFYKDMTNLHLINIYFSILGYFKDNKILHINFIRLYYKITQNQSIRKLDDSSLLHVYPFAVKFTITDNLEKAQYFEKNLNELHRENDIEIHKTKQYALMNALQIENTLFWRQNKIDFKNEIENIENKNNLQSKIDALKGVFKTIFKTDKIHLFISPYISVLSKDYSSYLNESEDKLVNLFDSFESIDSYPENLAKDIKNLFYGMIDIKKNTNKEPQLVRIETKDISINIDNTWANIYSDRYVVVRLVSIDAKMLSQNKNVKDNNPIWFKPIGCIVVEKEHIDFKLQMEITRTILSLKEYIVRFLEKEFSYKIVQEAISKKTIKQKIKRELEEKQSDIIKNINHSIKDYLDIAYTIKKHKKVDYNDISIYVQGLKYMSSIALIECYDKDETQLIDILFNKDNNKETSFVKEIKDFIKVAHKFSNAFWENVNDSTFVMHFSVECGFSLKINKDKMRYLIFEFIFNALKSKIGNTEEPKIILELYNDGFSIANSIAEDSLQHSKDIINNNNDSQRQGIKRIKQVLEGNSYEMKAIDDNGMLKIVVKSKERNDV